MPRIDSVWLTSVPVANNGAKLTVFQTLPSKRLSATCVLVVVGAAETNILNAIPAFADVGAVILSRGLTVIEISGLMPAPRSQLPSLVIRSFPDFAKYIEVAVDPESVVTDFPI